MDERDLDERLKLILTPEFDQKMKHIYASTQKFYLDGRYELSDDSRTMLNSAIEGLYDAFADYKMSDPLSCCDHCVTADEVRRLRSASLRELTHDDLWTVATNIVSTMGDGNDYRYFVPRMIEGLTENALYDAEIVFSKLPLVGFPSWPVGERAAVNTYLRAQFNADLGIKPGTRGIWSLGTLLCCIGIAGLDATPYLDAWASSTDESAMQSLIEFSDADVSPGGRMLENAFWSDCPANRQIIDWLHQPSTIAFAERAYDRFPLDGAAANRFCETLDALRKLAST